MSNPQRGEVPVPVDGKRYTLAFSINAVCALEGELGMGVNDLAAMLSDRERIRMTMMRTVFRVGLSDHHPDIDDLEAGRIMTALGATEAMRLVGEAFRLAFPDPEEHEQGVPPRQPTSGTVATVPPRGNGSIS